MVIAVLVAAKIDVVAAEQRLRQLVALHEDVELDAVPIVELVIDVPGLEVAVAALPSVELYLTVAVSVG
jgi:hypothetical protein